MDGLKSRFAQGLARRDGAARSVTLADPPGHRDVRKYLAQRNFTVTESALFEGGDRALLNLTRNNIMPGMAGTERFQQLCSLEYLHAYFARVLPGKVVSLVGLTNVNDLAKEAGLDGSDAAGADEVYQGIFTRDEGEGLKVELAMGVT